MSFDDELLLNVIPNFGGHAEDYELKEIPDEIALALTFDEKLTAIRNQRDRLLAECDFTQLPDAPISSELKTAYATYRQALRDLPETITVDNIDSVQFPAKPE
ncbi:MAG: hypothetical protein GT589_03825 [Peptoclostridium sp.]|nr:hypothetical protein [Peptoclostridium sp.]